MWTVKIRDPFLYEEDEVEYIYEQDGFVSYDQAYNEAQEKCIDEYLMWTEGELDVDEGYFDKFNEGKSIDEVINVSRSLGFYVEFREIDDV